MEKLNKEIETLYIKTLQKSKVEHHLKKVKQGLKLKYKKLKDLELIVDKDEEELKRLEKLSLTGLFSKILGNKEEQLERRRQSYLLSYMKYHECKKQIDAKEYEIKVLHEKIQSVEAVEATLQKLINKKKSLLKLKNKTAAKKIITQEFEIRKCNNKEKEIKEALVHAQQIIPKLIELETALLKIKSWKRNIDNPQLRVLPFYNQKQFLKKEIASVGNIETAIENLIEELNDVYFMYKIDYSSFTDQISNFLSKFCDGLISDWIFRKEIKVSLNTIVEFLDKINRIISMLEKDLATTTQEIEKQQQLLHDLILLFTPD